MKRPPRSAFGASPQGAPPAARQSRIRGDRSMAPRFIRRGCRFGAKDNPSKYYYPDSPF